MTPYLDLGLSTRELRLEIDEALAHVLDSGRYIGGSEVDSFEQEFARYCGAKYAVGTGNGLDALTLMLRAMGVGEGDEVIVPSNTYIATWLAVSAVGARPVPAEPDLLTYNLDAARVANAITRRTKAILSVHLYGQEADLKALGEIAERHGIQLAIDAAQAHGIRFAGYPCAYSFYPTKNLGALGDAGCVVTDDGRLAEKIRVLGNYGSRRKYIHEVAGVNSRLDPVQAAILRVKLAHLDEWNERRRSIARKYIRQLDGIPDLVLPNFPERGGAVWHVFAIRHPERDWLRGELQRAEIETLIHYPIPPHLSRAYESAGYKRGDFPIAEEIAATELSLPLHPHLTEEQVDDVVSAVCLAGCLPAGAGR